MNLEELRLKVKENGIVLDDVQISQYRQYIAFLKEYNEKVNLTAITEDEEIIEKHFYDSLLCAFDCELKGSLLDVGSGAGFPGVVLKIAFPELKVTLLESINKKCVFLKELTEKLGLKDIEVINGRSEEYSADHRETYDFVTARAVASLNVLLEISGAMVKKDGCFIALRGQSGLKEIKEAENAVSKMGFVISRTVERKLPDGSERVISYMKKEALTPKKYPRKYSIIKQKPL